MLTIPGNPVYFEDETGVYVGGEPEYFYNGMDIEPDIKDIDQETCSCR